MDTFNFFGFDGGYSVVIFTGQDPDVRTRVAMLPTLWLASFSVACCILAAYGLTQALSVRYADAEGCFIEMFFANFHLALLGRDGISMDKPKTKAITQKVFTKDGWHDLKIKVRRRFVLGG